MPQPFYRAVVQVDVSDIEFGRIANAGRIAFDCESMILRRDQHAAAGHFPHRVVSAAMAEGEL